MMRTFFTRLQIRLLLILVAVLIFPSFFVSYWTNSVIGKVEKIFGETSTEILTSHVITHLEALTKRKAGGVESSLRSIETTLATITEYVSSKKLRFKNDGELLRHLGVIFEKLLAMRYINCIFVWDPRMRLIKSYPHQDLSSLRGYLLTHPPPSKWTLPYPAGDPSRLRIACLAPLTNPKFIGMEVELSKLLAEKIQILEIKGVNTFLVDEGGGIIETHSNISLEEHPQLRPFITEMKRGEAGVKQVDLSSEGYYLAYAPIKNLGWSLGLLVPVKEATFPFSDAILKINRKISSLRKNLVISLLLLIFFIVMIEAVAIKRLIINPVEELYRGAQALQRGDLDYRVKIRGKTELGLLGETFNNMAQNLKANMAKLLESEEKYRKVMERASDGIFLFDEKGAFLEVNNKTLEILGGSQESLLKKGLPELVFPKDKKKLSRGLRELAKRGNALMELELKREDGKSVPVLLSLSEIHTTKTTFYLGIMRDFSDRKRMEWERIETERLKTAVDLARTVAHELNQPLTGVVGYCSLIREGMSPEDKFYEDIKKIERQAERIEELIKKFQNIVRVEKKGYLGKEQILDIEKSSRRET